MNKSVREAFFFVTFINDLISSKLFYIFQFDSFFINYFSLFIYIVMYDSAVCEYAQECKL